jgi:hypothetical protein
MWYWIVAGLKEYKILKLLFIIFSNPFYFKHKLQYKKMLKDHYVSDRFNQIYENNLWLSKETRSGEGSELNYTSPFRSWLIKKLPQLKIKIFVDAPCGDFNWMRKVIAKSNIYYFGFDIVEAVIKKNKIYTNNKVNFNVANICQDRLPDCDLLMVRDCLFHFSYDDINKFLKNISKIKYKYLLTTTHIVDKKFLNRDIITADVRIIDLFSHPFNFEKKKILDRVNDFPKGYKIPREMILFAKKDVPTSIIYDI